MCVRNVDKDWKARKQNIHMQENEQYSVHQSGLHCNDAEYKDMEVRA